MNTTMRKLAVAMGTVLMAGGCLGGRQRDRGRLRRCIDPHRDYEEPGHGLR